MGSSGSATSGVDWTVRHVGCTGSREGVSSGQRAALCQILERLFVPDSVLHHGDCVGSDAEIATLGRHFGFRLHSHPPTNPRFRAFVDSDLFSSPLPYLRRNEVIVESVTLLVATPGGSEELRSGTWSTVRYARSLRVPIVLCWPDGRTTCELHKVVQPC